MVKKIDIPEVVTKDRHDIHKIIEYMLENPDEHGIYPTTLTYNKLEALLQRVRMEACGWTWSVACIELDNDRDPRQYEEGKLIEKIEQDLNPPIDLAIGQNNQRKI